MKRTRTSFLDGMVRFFAIILLLCLVMGVVAGRVDPRDSSLIPFFGLAYPYLLFLNVVMLAWWLIRGRWVFAFISIAVILSGWSSLTATFSFTGDAGVGPKQDSSLVRMMTYNVHSFKPYDSGAVDSVKRQMLAIIREENPDILCLQEYYTRKKGAYALTDSLKAILGTESYYFVPSSENSYEATGLAIFSKYPIKGKGKILFDMQRGGNESIYVDLEVGKRSLRVYNVHLQSISFNKQDYQYLDKVTKKMDPDIVPSKRILGMLRNAFLKRSEQVDIMKQHLSTCEHPYLIAGDFNDTPASYAVTQLTASLHNAFKKKGKGLGKTYNGKFPNFQIDYIATTPDIEVMNHRIIGARLSDHFPLRSDLRLNP